MSKGLLSPINAPNREPDIRKDTESGRLELWLKRDEDKIDYRGDFEAVYRFDSNPAVFGYESDKKVWFYDHKENKFGGFYYDNPNKPAKHTSNGVLKPAFDQAIDNILLEE